MRNIARQVAREGITAEYAASRIDAQKSNETFIDLCDHVLENRGSREDFQRKCLAFFSQLAIIKENL